MTQWRIVVVAGALAATFAAPVAAQTTPTGQTSTDTRPPQSTSTYPSSDATDLHKFVQTAAVSNMAEVNLGKLALERAQDPEVKEFAQMMIDEHTKAQQDLKQAASAGGVDFPTVLDEKHQQVSDKLSGLNGSEFDREYMKVMVDEHQDAEDLLKDRAGNAASATSTNPSSTSDTGTTGTTGTTGSMSGGGAEAQVASWAAATLPKVRTHLERAKSIADRIGK
jgi:putative membrane protein